METRKITVISTKSQSKKVINSNAETLGELKQDLTNAGISYEDMTFYEGTSRTELVDDASRLPKDVPYKGTITNELVFMLTNSNKKIKSGASERARVYDEIKKAHLEETVKSTLGKNFTQCKTEDLQSILNSKRSKKEVAKETPSKKENSSSTVEVKDLKAREAIMKVAKEILSYKNFKEVATILSVEVAKEKVEDSPYSDNEIADMFNYI